MYNCGITHSSLLMARQRLAPISKTAKIVTIPRIELLALLIGVCLTNFGIHEMHLPIKDVHIFSDSQVVLNWVQSSTKHGTFVNNREMNPADCATEGQTKDQLKAHMW
ncbi:unnamed protein product [Haemonchus placei]|uniref:RNase H domain-containing protein n=1 Tax=Haemonchus placei TaxID=6290 RepID=A0A0N4WBW7_HAEPC|nr:unnamed protein product [Haemonchus placei]